MERGLIEQQLWEASRREIDQLPSPTDREIDQLLDADS